MLYDTQKLTAFAAAVGEKAGLNPKDSILFAKSLVQADMRGVSSHGVTRLKAYISRLTAGVMDGAAEPVITDDGGSILRVDAQNGVGMVTAHKIMEICIARAKETGSCFAAVTGGNHFGYAAYFTQQAADAGMIGLASANSIAAMAPMGGKTPLLGTNPLSIAVPAGKYRPLVLDMATSVVARGKVTLAAKEGKEIPLGWGIDANGVPTTDPAKVATVLPFGGAKGYGISLIITILSSCLSGALADKNVGSMYNCTRPQNNGFFLGAVDITRVIPKEVFLASVDALFDSVKGCEKADGVQEIYIPGEIEFGRAERAAKEGIRISDAVIKELTELSAQFGVPFDCITE